MQLLKAGSIDNVDLFNLNDFRSQWPSLLVPDEVNVETLNLRSFNVYHLLIDASMH